MPRREVARLAQRALALSDAIWDLAQAHAGAKARVVDAREQWARSTVWQSQWDAPIEDLEPWTTRRVHWASLHDNGYTTIGSVVGVHDHDLMALPGVDARTALEVGAAAEFVTLVMQAKLQCRVDPRDTHPAVGALIAEVVRADDLAALVGQLDRDPWDLSEHLARLAFEVASSRSAMTWGFDRLLHGSRLRIAVAELDEQLRDLPVDAFERQAQSLQRVDVVGEQAYARFNADPAHVAAVFEAVTGEPMLIDDEHRDLSVRADDPESPTLAVEDVDDRWFDAWPPDHVGPPEMAAWLARKAPISSVITLRDWIDESALAQVPPAYAAGGMPPAKRIAVLDVETSGLYPSDGDCVTWLAVRTLAHDDMLVNVAVREPDRPPHFGEAPAHVPRVSHSEMVARWQAALDGHDLIVAHVADFDSGFAVAEFAKTRPRAAVPQTPWLCTMRLSRWLFPDWDNHTLEHACDQFAVPYGKHLGDADVHSTIEVFNGLVHCARAVGVTDLIDLLLIAGIAPGADDALKWDGRARDLEQDALEVIEQARREWVAQDSEGSQVNE